MSTVDKDSLLLCNIQGKLFELSISLEKCSSSVFIRRYMNSTLCERMDTKSYLNEGSTLLQAFDELHTEYGITSFGTIKYTNEEMYWIGYIYRYFSCLYQLSSKQVYKIINSTDIRKLYYAYHTLDPTNAIERILESKNITIPRTADEFTKEGVEVLRRLWNEEKKRGA